MEKYEDIINAIEHPSEKELTPIEALINMMSSPIAKRKGLWISADDCKEWIEILKKYT